MNIQFEKSTVILTGIITSYLIVYDFGTEIPIKIIVLKNGLVLIVGIGLSLINEKIIKWVASGGKGPMGFLVGTFGWIGTMMTSLTTLTITRMITNKIFR